MQRVGAAVLVLAAFGGACATGEIRRKIPVIPAVDVAPFGRVLVAGFVPDGASQIDLNEETARFLRMELRSRASLQVIDSEPLDLANPSASDRNAVPGADGDSQRSDRNQSRKARDSEASDELFTDVGFWQRLGEEYSEPLIVTGRVAFKPVAPQYEEHTAGPRTVRLWRPGFRLQLRLVLISGETGEIIDVASLQSLSAHATIGREPALLLYLQLMDRMMPSVLGALAQRGNHKGGLHD
jgi:hypothetical protein